MISFESFQYSIMLMPVAIIGILIGYQLVKRVEEKLFYNVLYTLIFISSSKLIYDFFI